ncbi:MAG: hypothetical protein IT320_21940 [Anaerolineae bacterium]|nr:hypothetical protein [Anaerolineae bacterium]
MRNWKMVLLLVVVLALGVGVVQAQDEEENVPTISDGRVNSWDIAAPVVVYCTFEYPNPDDVNAGVFDTIELWGATGEDEFQLVATVTADEIEAAGVDAESSTVLTSAFGYSLYRAADGSFTVAAAPDAEGKVYSFNWSFGDQNC